MAKRYNILDVPADAIPITEAVDRIIAASHENDSRYVVKPYVEFADYPFPYVLHEAWLALPDGVALQWAAHYQQTSGSLWQLLKTLSQIVLQPHKIRSAIPEKFAGTNFTSPLLEAAAANGRSVFLVGAPKHGTIQDTARTLQSTFPGLHIAGVVPGKDESGKFSERLEIALTNELQQNTPDIILVGLGHPLQEEVMYRLKPRLSHGIMIGEGGSFDYQEYGGRIKKAPAVMQYLSLEWVWRLILEPRRIRRQLAIPRFIVRVYRDLHRR